MSPQLPMNDHQLQVNVTPHFYIIEKNLNDFLELSKESDWGLHIIDMDYITDRKLAKKPHEPIIRVTFDKPIYVVQSLNKIGILFDVYHDDAFV